MVLSIAHPNFEKDKAVPSIVIVFQNFDKDVDIE
jgi:hypothetical protein